MEGESFWLWETLGDFWVFLVPYLLYYVSSGMLLATFVGVGLTSFDTLIGMRAHTLYHNWTSRPERQSSASPEGFIVGRGIVYRSQVAAIFGVVYALAWSPFTGGDGVIATIGSYLWLLLDMAEFIGGMLIGFYIAPVFGRVLRTLLTLGGFVDYSKMRGLRWFVGRVGDLYNWGHAAVNIPEDEARKNALRVSLERTHTRLWWLCYYLRTALFRYAREHKWRFALIFLVVVALLVYNRAYIQPLAIDIRVHLGQIVALGIFAAVLYGLWRLIPRLFGERWYVQIGSVLLIASLAVGAFQVSGVIQKHMTLWMRYQTLSIVEVAKLPLERNTRVLPLAAVGALANERLEGPYEVFPPDYVRTPKGHRWTMPIEYARPMPKMFANIEELFSVPATAASVTFDRESGNRVGVCFATGEHQYFSRNTYTAVRRAFGPWQYWNYEPVEERHLQNDRGEWVKLVTLVKYRGFFFPRPEFGGVMVIKQEARDASGDCAPGIGSTLKRLFLGLGEWISPDSISKHAYLAGNNLVPDDVTRLAAESMRYRNGVSPVWFGTDVGDVRIPDRLSDYNRQPYNTDWTELPAAYPAGIAQYFALEPRAKGEGEEGFGENARRASALALQLWIPADGTYAENGDLLVFARDHTSRADAYGGVSRVAGIVRSARKDNYWQVARVVEARPWIRDIAGERRLLFLVEIMATRSDGSLVADGEPDLMIVDTQFNLAVSVDVRNQGSWEETVEKEFATVWLAKR